MQEGSAIVPKRSWSEPMHSVATALSCGVHSAVAILALSAPQSQVGSSDGEERGLRLYEAVATVTVG